MKEQRLDDECQRSMGLVNCSNQVMKPNQRGYVQCKGSNDSVATWNTLTLVSQWYNGKYIRNTRSVLINNRMTMVRDMPQKIPNGACVHGVV